MPPKTKEEARANLESSITFIPDRFRRGVSRADWATPAGSEVAEKNYAEALTKAIAAKKRQTEIRKISNATWQTQAINKGAPVIGERIRAALGTWVATWGPMYDQVVSAVATLPARTLDWRVNINNRVAKVVETWKKAAGKS